MTRRAAALTLGVAATVAVGRPIPSAAASNKVADSSFMTAASIERDRLNT